jgi:hypothetical protein
MKSIKSLLLTTIAVLGTSCFSVNAAFINFNDYTPENYVNQGISGSATSSADGSSLTLTGNLWVTISELFNVTSDSTLYFTFEATGVEAEWYGIGFDDNDSITASNLFQIGGPEGTGANQISTYTFGDGAADFAIDVGSYFTGVFDKLVFILDADSMSGASATFSNVEVCNDVANCESLSSTPSAPVAVSSPGIAGLFAISLLALIGRKRSKL